MTSRPSSEPDDAASTIWNIVKPKLDSHTLSLPLLLLVEEHARCCRKGVRCDGLGGGEITKRYNILADEFGLKRYSDAATYVTRTGGIRRQLFEEVGEEKYRIRSPLADPMKTESWEWLVISIRAAIAGKDSRKNAWIARLQRCMESPIEDIDGRALVLRSLLETEGDKGQAFEIGVYSVLATYVARLGFDLKRFSVTSSADGGMDFVAGTALYQVSKTATSSKLESDFLKLPGTKRVFVVSRLPAQIPENPDVLAGCCKIPRMAQPFCSPERRLWHERTHTDDGLDVLRDRHRGAHPTRPSAPADPAGRR